jgi:hypothetical protein
LIPRQQGGGPPRLSTLGLLLPPKANGRKRVFEIPENQARLTRNHWKIIDASILDDTSGRSIEDIGGGLAKTPALVPARQRPALLN